MSIHLDFDISQSSLIEYAIYFEEEKDFEIKLRWMDWSLVYANVQDFIFNQFCEAVSKGGYYNQIIKPHYKLKQKQTVMADEKNKPKKVHRKNDEQRVIEIDISVSKIKKEWLFITDSGDVRLKMKFIEKPQNEISEYGQIGFLKQHVPAHVYKDEKAKKDKDDDFEMSKDVILGNAEELEWNKGGATESRPMTDSEAESAMDDLPF